MLVFVESIMALLRLDVNYFVWLIFGNPFIAFVLIAAYVLSSKEKAGEKGFVKWFVIWFIVIDFVKIFIGKPALLSYPLYYMPIVVGIAILGKNTWIERQGLWLSLFNFTLLSLAFVWIFG